MNKEWVAMTAAQVMPGICAAVTISDPGKPFAPAVVDAIAANALALAQALADKLDRHYQSTNEQENRA
jgi:hypothetical protein